MRELESLRNMRVRELARDLDELTKEGRAHLIEVANIDIDDVARYEVTENATHKLVEVEMMRGKSKWFKVRK